MTRLPNADFHTHTNLCDGKNTPREMAERAVSLGLSVYGFSGHMDPIVFMRDLPAYIREIHSLREELADRIEILCGTEVDVLTAPWVYETPGLQYRIGSTHFVKPPGGEAIPIDATAEITEALCREYYGGDYLKLARDYYALEAEVVKKTDCTFVGHFDLISRFNDEKHWFDETDPAYLAPAFETLRVIRESGVPIEINCGAYNRQRKAECYPHPAILREWKEMGGEILINSDAHDRDHITAGFEKAVETARSCGFRSALILQADGEERVKFEEVSLGE